MIQLQTTVSCLQNGNHIGALGLPDKFTEANKAYYEHFPLSQNAGEQLWEASFPFVIQLQWAVVAQQMTKPLTKERIKKNPNT